MLLSIMPKASTYEFRRFDPAKMVDLLRNTQLQQGAAQAQPGQNWGPYQQQAQRPAQQSNMMVGGPSGTFFKTQKA